MIVVLQLKKKLVTLYEDQCDLNKEFFNKNKDKTKQLEFVMKMNKASEVLHLDDSRTVAKLQMEGVKVFHYEPRCVENNQFVTDQSVHQWFIDFVDTMNKIDPEMAGKIKLQGQCFEVTEAHEEYALKFSRIVSALESNQHLLRLRKNDNLYHMFFQNVSLFQQSFEYAVCKNDRHCDTLLMKDKCFLGFVENYIQLTKQPNDDLFVLLRKMIDLIDNGVMQALRAQFPEVDFDSIKACMISDVVKLVFIKASEHLAYEQGKKYDHSHRVAVQRVFDHYRHASQSPEDFRKELNNLLYKIPNDREGYNALQPVTTLDKNVINRKILKFLEPRDMCRLNATCRFFHRSISAASKKNAVRLILDNLPTPLTQQLRAMAQVNCDKLIFYVNWLKDLMGVINEKSECAKQIESIMKYLSLIYMFHHEIPAEANSIYKDNIFVRISNKYNTEIRKAISNASCFVDNLYGKYKEVGEFLQIDQKHRVNIPFFDDHTGQYNRDTLPIEQTSYGKYRGWNIK